MRAHLLLIVAALSMLGYFAAAPAALAANSTPIRVAPADEYFGRLKMSILGIRNQLRDLDLRLQYAPGKSADVLGAATMVEDAMRDWERKYPADPWLAKTVFQLTSLYARVHTPDGQQRAARTYKWLLARYGHTTYGIQARTQIGSALRL